MDRQKRDNAALILMGESVAISQGLYHFVTTGVGGPPKRAHCRDQSTSLFHAVEILDLFKENVLVAASGAIAYDGGQHLPKGGLGCFKDGSVVWVVDFAKRMFIPPFVLYELVTQVGKNRSK